VDGRGSTVLRAHSFDVFDTCLVRRWARPVDVLRAVADRVVPPDAPRRGELVSELVRLRRMAEVEAMERLRVDAVGLEQIYAEGAAALAAVGIDAAAMHAGELEVERAAIRPVRAARDRIAVARADRLRVLFVSDMYLPGHEIRSWLLEHDMAHPEDPVYVSGDLGVSKRTGRLFDHVLAQEGLRPEELVHTGDDPVTDDAAAAGRGITVRPFRAAKMTRLERAMIDVPEASLRAGTQLAGLTRGTRVALAPEHGRMADAAAIIAGLVAPMFGAFVAWVLQTARAEGLERLYFVSRDAQVLLRAARELRRDGDPECRYLYGSRQAWFAPGVDAVDPASLYWVLEPEWSLKTPRALLAKLDLRAEELAPALKAHRLPPDDRLDPAGLERFWAVLDAERDLVLRRATERRERVSRYFAQEGLHEGRWALVDVGWRLTAQRALRRVLADTGHEDRLLGLYFGLSRERANRQDTGAYRAFILQDNQPGWTDLPEDWLFGNTSLVEQVFAMADHGSCVGYRDGADGRVEPVLRDMDPDPERDRYRECLHAALVDFAREAAASGLLDQHLEEVRAAALHNGRAVIDTPTRAEAEAIAWMRVGDDQNETRTRELAGPLTVGSLALRVRTRLGLPVARDFATDHLWHHGSVALSSPAVQASMRTIKWTERLARDARARARRSPSVRRLKSVRA
jgi:predicted HAD superfamily hydrolase